VQITRRGNGEIAQSSAGSTGDPALDDLIAAAAAPLVFTDGPGSVDGGGVPPEYNYRLAEMCATCSYYDEDSGMCRMFDTEVEPEMVCDAWTDEGDGS
jgi:hypothetical protein